jgi:hypothetical protein
MLHRGTDSTQSRVLRRDQIFISIILILAIQALDGSISSTDTVTRSLYISNIPHTLTLIPRIWPSSQMTLVGGHWSIHKFFLTIGQVCRISWWRLDLTSTCVLQLPLASWSYMTGVSRTLFWACCHSNDISSINNWPRGRLTSSLEQPTR